MNFLSDLLNVRYDDKLKSVVIEHPDKGEFPTPLVQVREETYAGMTFEKLAEFLGARLLLLMPAMRDHFKQDIERMKNKS